MIFSATEALIGQVQVLFGHQKQWNPPFGFGLPWTFKCYSCNSIATYFATKEQLFHTHIQLIYVLKEQLWWIATCLLTLTVYKYIELQNHLQNT